MHAEVLRTNDYDEKLNPQLNLVPSKKSFYPSLSMHLSKSHDLIIFQINAYRIDHDILWAIGINRLKEQMLQWWILEDRDINIKSFYYFLLM